MALQRSRSSTAGRARRKRGVLVPKSEVVSLQTGAGKSELQFEWAGRIEPEEWATYLLAIRTVRQAGIPFMLGGGFALAAFTGRWRDTKDIDFYIRPQDRDVTVAALSAAGFADYYDRLPYDRKWIYRSVNGEVIVDIIWSMANQRAQVDGLWFERAGSVCLRGEQLRVIPREEFVWCKLYILQRDHCDWTDIFNVLYAGGGDLDWKHLLWRLQDDLPLLKGLLTVYGWLCPTEVLRLPEKLWSRIGLPRPEAAASAAPRNRIRLLDSRCWFAALKAPGEKLDV